MNIKRLLLFLAAPLALLMNSCVPNGPEYTLPEISVTTEDGVALTSINFPEEGGEQKFVIKATRSWNINSQADWFGITPLSYSNPDMVETVVQAIITAAPNDGEARNETIKISMDKTELSITVAQAGKGQVALGDVLYYDNFDKGGQAQKGSNGWDTYMDGDKGRAFCNPTPENQAGVSYTGTKLTVRSNSSNGSGGTHSNYEGSGVNYLWFGTAPTNFTISGISLAELEGNALTLSFGTERYEYNATDNTFNNNEFKVYISGDGEKWTELSYSFLEGVNLNGKWNIATSQFNLKEVPETISLYFTASVGAAYALDDVKLTAGGGGAEIDLSAGGAIEGGNTGGGNTGGGTGSENAVKATVAEFLNAAEDNTIYELTGTVSGNVTSHYGNFDLTDDTATVYIYGLVDSNNKFIWDELGIKVGDTITIQGNRTSYNGTPQMKNALYISHVAGEGGGTTEPEPPVAGDGEYASDSPFVQAADDSTNAVYTLGNDSKVNGQTATGFKLGKSKQQGKFTSKAIGVSGDKYLNFYAVAWGAGGDQTIYFRVNGGEAIAQPIKANDGAAGNPPYTITVSDSDHYSILLSGLTESSVIEFSTNSDFALSTHSGTNPDIAPRAIFFGVKLTDEANGEGGNTGGGTTDPEPDPEPEPTPDPTPGTAIKATIQEFLNAAESTTQWYELTGEITSIEKADYGNIYIQDETASVLIYGLCATKVEKNDKSFSSLGLKVGDIVTLHSLRTSYNGTPQGGGSTNPAYYISHVEGEPEPEPEVPAGSAVASVTFSTLGLSNAEDVNNRTFELDNNVSVVFKQGGANNPPAYYDSGSAIRMYQNGATLDVTANGKTITSIEITFASNMYYVVADSGELSAEATTRTWTGSATDVKFTCNGTDKSHRAYVAAIKVTYTE